MEQDKLHPRAYLTLAILFLFTIFSYVDRMVIVLLVDPIRHDLGISDVQISLLQGLAFALCYTLASFPLGWLADRYSRRWVIYGGITIWSLATASGGLASSFGELFVARFFVGIGEAALLPAAFSMLAELFPADKRASASGILTSAITVGAGVALFAGGPIVGWATHSGGVSLPMVGLLHPWQVVFMSVGLPGLLAAFLIFLAPETGHSANPNRQQDDSQGMRAWLAQHWLFVTGITIASAIMALTGYAIASWTPTYLSRVLKIEMADVGMSLGLVQIVTGLTGTIGGGVLIDRLHMRGVTNVGYKYIIAIAAFVLVVVPPTFLLLESFTLVLVALGAIFFVQPWMVATVFQLQLAAPPHFRARLIALVTMVTTFVGMAAGPSSVAIFTEYVFKDPLKVGWSIAAVFAIGAPLVIACLIVSYRASLRAVAAAPAEGADQPGDSGSPARPAPRPGEAAYGET